MKSWLMDRLKEKSTYIGLSILLGSFGVVVAPEHIEVIVAGAGMIAGTVQTIRKENKE